VQGDTNPIELDEADMLSSGLLYFTTPNQPRYLTTVNSVVSGKSQVLRINPLFKSLGSREWDGTVTITLHDFNLRGTGKTQVKIHVEVVSDILAE
jgi:hypothetical protein